MKLCVALFLLISFSRYLKAQEEVDRCFCDVVSAERVACPAGSNLDQSECLSNHCCYDGTTNSPSCYERKARCSEDRCAISPLQRQPCGSWQLEKQHCDDMDCCYDHRMFPYCYYSKEEYEKNEEKPEETASELKDDIIIDVNVATIGPNATHFNPDTSDLVKVECNDNDKGVPCGSALISRNRCLEMSCCWKESSNGRNCFHPATKAIDGKDASKKIKTLFEEYITLGDEDPNPSSDGYEEIDYGKFSVTIECLNMDVAGITKEHCPAKNRKRCLDTSCCWNGTDCLKPVSKFSNNTEDIDIPNVQGPHGSTKDPDFWKPVFVSVNIHEGVEKKKLICDHTMAALSCGFAGINRTACLEKGCCWMPQFAMSGRYDMLCSLPVLTDDIPSEVDELARDETQSDWGQWGSWSACYVTEPCSERAERMRWRVCESNKFESGCKFQDEQLHIVPCFKPKECLDTYWSEWSSWTKCSLSCGGFGVQERQRECVKGDTLEDSPLCEDVHAAFNHLIADKQIKECARNDCPK